MGKCREKFPQADPNFSGGPLEFEAYLLWTPKVAPTEHQGSLIRIHGSSGTLFAPTFLRYGVFEQARLRQITCEIFIHEGLDSALNIDRESFNNAHPHSVFISRWLHNALRQVATKQKQLSSEVRSEEQKKSQQQALKGLERFGFEIWQDELKDDGVSPPDVEFIDQRESKRSRGPDTIVFSRQAVMKGVPFPVGAKQRSEQALLESRLKAVTQVLAAFNLLEQLSPDRQERLLQAIQQIMTSENA